MKAGSGPLKDLSAEGKAFLVMDTWWGRRKARVPERRLFRPATTVESSRTGRRALFGLCPCMLEKLLSAGPTQGRERAFPTAFRLHPKKPTGTTKTAHYDIDNDTDGDDDAGNGGDDDDDDDDDDDEEDEHEHDDDDGDGDDDDDDDGDGFDDGGDDDNNNDDDIH